MEEDRGAARAMVGGGDLDKIIIRRMGWPQRH